MRVRGLGEPEALVTVLKAKQGTTTGLRGGLPAAPGGILAVPGLSESGAGQREMGCTLVCPVRRVVW